MILIAPSILSADGSRLHEEIAAGIARTGADVLVAGASVFGTDDYQQTIPALRAASNRGPASGQTSGL